jgi:hypothetical protein
LHPLERQLASLHQHSATNALSQSICQKPEAFAIGKALKIGRAFVYSALTS